MKLRTKIFSLFLAAIFFFGVFPAPAYAAIKSEVVGDEYTLQNDYIKVTVNSKTGRFSIGTVEGQKVRKNDQNTFLTFIGGLFGAGIGDSDTSFTTFRINGTDYIFGNDYDFTAPDGREVKSEMGKTEVFTHDMYEQIPEGCQAVITEWSVEDVHIMQILLIYPDTDDQKANSGNVQIFYNVENRSGKPVSVGARILMDTMVGANDGPQFQIGTISTNTLSVERMLTKDPHRDQGIAYENVNYWTMPDYWVMKDTLDPTNPLATNVIAYGYTDIAGYRDADYMIVSHWNKLANEKFEEFEDYVAIPAAMSEAASAVSSAQRVRDLLASTLESREADAIAKEAAYAEELASKGESTGGKTKLQLDAEEARETANKVRTALERAEENLMEAKLSFQTLSGGRMQIGESMIDPNLDFTVDTNDYGSADSAVAFYWSGEGDDAVIAPSSSMQIGTVYGLGEIIDPASVLAITFPNPVTQVEIDPDQADAYVDYGIFDVNVEVENLAMYDMKHDYIDITMTLENGLRFVKYDEGGNLVMGSDGKPQTSYNSTQTLTYQKAITPEQAERGENNPVLPGEKAAVTFKVMAMGKSWPTTREYMVTATSPQLEMEFENLYGDTAGEEIKALYNSSRSNFVFLPAVGQGTPSYSVSVSPDECFTGDPKYITVNMTNIEAYNPGSSVRGQETAPNFNLFLEEVVTGNRYQLDVTDNVQCIVTDDGLTGDMRITYADGTLVDADGIVLKTDLGPTLPVGEYRVRIDYISTDEDENAMLDMVSAQTFLVASNDEARIREPGVLAVVKETIPFDDDNIMQKITDLVDEVQAAIEELSQIADKLGDTDWADAIYDEVIDLAKEIISPVTQIYDKLEGLIDFSNIEPEMRALAKDFEELDGVDFSELKNFDLMKALKGVNVDISLSDYFKELFDVDTMILGPLGLSGLADAADGGVDGVLDSIKNYAKSFIDPFADIYGEIVELGDFSDLSNNEIAQLKSAFSELADVDFTALKSFDLGAALKGIYDSTEVSVGTKLDLEARFKQLTDLESLLLGPFASDAEGGGVAGVYDSILNYGKDMIAPIVNIYDEILDIADFSTLTKSEIAELKKAYSDLESLDFSEFEKLDLEKLFNSVNVSIKLSDKVDEMLSVEKLIGGPFASLLSGDSGTAKSLGDQLYDWVLGYAKKMAAPLLSIYDDIVNLADFDDIEDEMRELAKIYPELSDIDFSALSDFDFDEALAGLTDSIDVNVSLKDNFKKIFDYESILAGPFSGVKDENGNEKSALDVFTDRVLAYGEKMIRPIVSVYEDFEKIADFEDITREMNEIAKIYPELAGVDFSSLEGFDFVEALSLAADSLDASISLKDNFKKIFDYESILAGPFSGVKDENGNEKSALDVFTDRILAYGEKMIRPIVSIYEDLENIADFSNIEKEMEELAKIYPELADVDFSSLADFDFGEALARAADSIDINVSLSDNFKKIFDYETILAGPFSGVKDENGNEKSAMDVFEDRIIAYGEKMVRPILSIYEDIEKLADFDDIVKDMEAISKECDDIAGLDFSALEGFDISAAIKDLWNATTINVDLSDGFKATMNNVLAGPFEGGSFSESAFNNWISSLMLLYDDGYQIYDLGKKAYEGNLGVKEGAAKVLALYKKYVNANVSVDLNAAISEATKDAGQQAWTNSKKIGLAFVAIYAKMQTIYESIDAKYNKAQGVYNDIIGVKDKVVSFAKAIGNGDFSQLFSLGKDMLRFVLGEWLDPVYDAIDSAKTLYDIGKKAYEGNLSIEEGAALLMHFYEEYLDVSVDVDFKGVGDKNTVILSETAQNAKKMGLAFMAMYAKMQNIYQSLNAKYNKAKGVYEDVVGIKDTIVDFVKAIGNGDFSQLLSLGKDMLQFVLGEWLDPVYDAIDSAKTLYDIGKKAYEGKLSIEEGAKLVLHFYEEYLDVSVNVDFKGIGDKNTAILSESAANAKKMGLAFMAIYARMQTIYQSIDAKYNKAKEVYESVIGIKDTIVNFIKAIGNGDISQLLGFGKDMIEFVFGEWLNPVYDAIDSAKTLYSIGKKAYEGKLSIEEGAKLLLHFYEEYLDVSVSVDFKGIGDKNTAILSENAANAKKMGLAFMAMYAKMYNIYQSISDKIDRATQVYNDVRDLVDTVIQVGTQVFNGDFSAIISALKDAGADLFNNVLEAWLTPVMDTINSAKSIYDLAADAYNGNISVKKGAKLLMDFFETYLDVDVDGDFSVLKSTGGEAYTNYQKISGAFMIMYARLSNIYGSIESKVDRAVKVYDQAKGLIDTFIRIVKAIGSGDFSVILDKIMEVGKDIVNTIINYWLDQFKDVIEAGTEIYDIAMHAYKGDLTVEEGAKRLVNFYENYLNVSVKTDFTAIGSANMEALSASQKNAIKMASAFKVMFAQMKSLYSKISAKIDKAKGVYEQARGLINNILKLVEGLSDPEQLLNDLVDLGKDSIMKILNAYMDKINEMIQSVKDIYEVGKKAYEGKISVIEGAEALIEFFQKYFKVSISADLDAIGEENKKAASETYKQGKKMALAFVAMFARMKNLYSQISGKIDGATSVYDDVKALIDSVVSLFTDPAKGAYALLDLVKARIMKKL
ncbi:MAG: hypothetical protein IJT56_00775, partial [Clostridia bacterium]|nr:hypothetical protein [Clostridia bacterium]